MLYPSIPGTVPIAHTASSTLNHTDPLPPALTSPPFPTKGGKSIFVFWHSGIHTLQPYLLRNVLVLHHRFGPLGWNIYVLDSVPDSPLHFSKYIDASSPEVLPQALRDGALNGSYNAQHTSDLVRYPLLLRYGGLYLDVGILQFGDINKLWEEHIANPDSPYDFAGFSLGGTTDALSIVNFALMSIPDSPLVLRAHKILLKLWEGRTNTTGTHAHPLVSHVPLMHVPETVSVAEEGKDKMAIDDESMTDYAIQIQAMGSVQSWVDDKDGWNGPEYVRTKCWLYNMIDMAYVNEQLTGWSSQRQFELFSLQLPADGEEETADQKLAREIVQKSIEQSWCLKLAHGFSAKLFGAPTLGMLWRSNEGSDAVEGTYGGWLRWAQLHLEQKELPKGWTIPVYKPTMVASLESML